MQDPRLNRVWLGSLALAALVAGAASAQQERDWQLGTVLSVTTSPEQGNFAAPLGSATVAIPVPRNRHAYVITGGDKEYVVGEATPLRANITVNRTVYYATEGERFVFVDDQGYEHQGAILRETPLKQSLIPRDWKSAVGDEHLSLRVSADGKSIYAEDVNPQAAKKGFRTQYEARLNAGQYVGQVHRTMPCGTFHAEVNLTAVTPDRIEGFMMGPPIDARWDGRKCSYSKPNEVFRFVWIPE